MVKFYHHFTICPRPLLSSAGNCRVKSFTCKNTNFDLAVWIGPDPPPPCGLNPNILFFEGFPEPKSILFADGKLFTYKILLPILLQFDAV